MKSVQITDDLAQELRTFAKRFDTTMQAVADEAIMQGIVKWSRCESPPKFPKRKSRGIHVKS